MSRIIIQPESSPPQGPIVPSPQKSYVSTIVQPETLPPQGPIVPSPQKSDASMFVQPETLPSQGPIVPSPQKSDVSMFVQTSPPQVPIVPSLPDSDAPPQVPTVPSPNITAAPIPEASFQNPQTTFNSSFNQYLNHFPQTIPNSSFTPNFTQTFSLTDFNPQQSLTDLMSETLYKWPANQDQQALGDQDLFDFSGFQDFSGMNTFNSNMSNFLDTNVRFVLQGLQHLQIVIHIHRSPLLHPQMATISTTPLKISTRCPTSLLQHP